MNLTRNQSGQEPFVKQIKSPIPIPKEKIRTLITTSLRAAVTVIFVLTVSFALYSATRGGPRSNPILSQDPTRFVARPVQVQVPIHHLQQTPTNISHIAFGIGGSTATWPTRGRYADLWWDPNLTRGFVFLEKEPDADGNTTAAFKIRHRVSSDWTGFRSTSGSPSAVRLARVVVDLFAAGLADVRWFVMGDDDTVFFPANLAAVLSRYDHRLPLYVGGSSESVEQNVMHAYGMAFGGGGFAISYPLAVELVGLMDGCLNRYHYFYGSDQRVWACISELGVGLTRESGFHQLDIRGDPFGFLSAHPLSPLVSLHHLDHVKPLFHNRTQLDSLRTLMRAYEVDPLRTLQQCFCYNRRPKWSISISWGYVVQIYPALIPAHELEKPLQTFQTWRSWKDGPFTFNTRPVSSDICQQPIIFYLDSVLEEDSGNASTTTYKKAMNGTGVDDCKRSYARATAVETVVVSAPKMDAREWDQRPRRHCCEIDEISSTGEVRIQIRKCKESESISI